MDKTPENQLQSQGPPWPRFLVTRTACVQMILFTGHAFYIQGYRGLLSPLPLTENRIEKRNRAERIQKAPAIAFQPPHPIQTRSNHAVPISFGNPINQATADQPILATLDLAAIHESLDVMQHGTSSAQVLLRMGGLMLLACKVAAATATDLVTDAHLQQQQQQQQQPPGGDGGAGPSQGGGGGGLLGLAAANLMDSYGLVPNEHHGHGGLRSTEPKGAPASAPSAFAAAAPHSSAAISSTVRQLLGLLLGPHEPWGLSMDEETSQGGSVAAVAAAAAAAAGNGHAHAPKVGWGMAGHVAAGLPQLLGSTAHWLSSMVVEAVATAAMQPAGAPTALAAACPLVRTCVCDWFWL
eukprot:1146016-Pelagomonas_calceolata.AAC.11